MNRYARISILILAFCLAWGSFGQVIAQDEPVTMQIDWIDISKFPEITVLVSVWNADGLSIADLEIENFSFQEDSGDPIQPATLHAAPNMPLSVGLVLDTSESMIGDPISDSREAAMSFLDQLRSDDRAALIAFSSGLNPNPASLNPKLELDFSDNLKPLYGIIENLEAYGQTHLYNAATKMVALTENEPEGRRAILLLTDGRNEPADVGDPEEVIQRAKDANIPFFVIGLGRAIDEPYLTRLATETGGLFRFAPTSDELGELFDEMAARLKTQYTLTYTSEVPPDGQEHELSVTVNTDAGTAIQVIKFGPVPFIPTVTPTPTFTPSPTLTPSQTQTATLTPSLTPTTTPSQTPTSTFTLTPTFTPTFTPTPTQTPTPTPTPIPTILESITSSTAIWCPGVIFLALAALLWIIIRRRQKKN